MTPFSQAFATTFASRTRGCPPSEIALFRELQATVAYLSTQFLIEEYHGARSQVVFKARQPWRRGAGRCELADLMIITFQQRPSERIRLTFLQAKSERSRIALPCTGSLPAFWGNYEQWDLLSSRPTIHPTGSARPPSNVLSGALLSSVGSFGFFYLDQSRNYQVCYSAADYLQPVMPVPRHMGRLIFRGHRCIRRTSGYLESPVACCSLVFARALELGLIGTPLEQITPDEPYRARMRSWLHSVVRAAVSRPSGLTANNMPTPPVASALLEMLADDVGDADDDTTPTPSLVLLETENSRVTERPLRRYIT